MQSTNTPMPNQLIHKLFSFSCFEMFSNKSLFLGSDIAFEPYTGIPWQVGLKRGSSLEAGRDSIEVKEEGFFFVYSQVGALVVISWFLHRVLLLLCVLITRFYTGPNMSPYSGLKRVCSVSMK